MTAQKGQFNKKMIRFFYGICKTLLAKISDFEIYMNAVNDFSYYSERCPRCGAGGKLFQHDNYIRNLVFFIESNIIVNSINTQRYKCHSCKSTHALLPEIIVPHSSYSIRFKLTVLSVYFKGDMTIKAICERFEIAISTLYDWKERFLEHKDLQLGVLTSGKKPALDFLIELLESDDITESLRSFFLRYTFSFLQGRSVPAARSQSP